MRLATYKDDINIEIGSSHVLHSIALFIMFYFSHLCEVFFNCTFIS